MAGKKLANGPVRRLASAAAPPEVVDPVWLLKAFGVVMLVALVCAYLTLCGLFYRGQWQLVLHPARTASAPATVAGMPVETVRFGAAQTGVPQLTGWWIPASAAARFGHLTVLYLPGGDGSLLDDAAILASLHEAGVSVFAIDYRGYGQSADTHPNEQSMTEDAESAWEYLLGPRRVAAERVIAYGRGVGASLALGLAAEKGASAVVLDAPDFHVIDRVGSDPRSRLLPVRWLLHDRFTLVPAIEQTRVPKLILSRGDRQDPEVLRAADPKLTVTLPRPSPSEYGAAISRFLDQYAPPPAVPVLGMPTAAVSPSAPQAEKPK